MAGQASLLTTIAGATTAIGHIVSISGPNISGSKVDVSELTDTVVKYVPGQVDLGEVTVGLRYEQANHQTLTAQIATNGTPALVQVFTISIPEASGGLFTFSGYMKGLNTEVPEDGSIDGELTIKLSGDTVPDISQV